VCPKETIVRLRRDFRKWTEQLNLNSTQKETVLLKIIAEIATQNETAAKQITSAYFEAASDSTSKVAENDLQLLVMSLDDVGRLKRLLQREAKERPDWARAILGNARLVMESIETSVTFILSVYGRPM